MKIKLLASVLTLVSLMASNFQTHADEKTLSPTLIVVNAKVHTMDASKPLAEAVAIYG